MNSPSQHAGAPVTANIKVRPPLLFLGAFLFGFGLDHLLPLPRLIPSAGPIHSISAVFAGFLVLTGIAVFTAGIHNFIRANTPVPGNQSVRVLVTTGIHGWSRNPIYIAMLMVYAGIGIAARSPWILVLAVPVIIMLRYAVIAREETYLEQRFGSPYRDYRARVRRWL